VRSLTFFCLHVQLRPPTKVPFGARSLSRSPTKLPSTKTPSRSLRNPAFSNRENITPNTQVQSAKENKPKDKSVFKTPQRVIKKVTSNCTPRMTLTQNTANPLVSKRKQIWSSTKPEQGEIDFFKTPKLKPVEHRFDLDSKFDDKRYDQIVELRKLTL